MTTVAKVARAQSMLLLMFVSSLSPGVYSQTRYPASGLVLKIDQTHKTAVISCNAIPGYMEAMTMPISVRSANDLKNLRPGTMIDFVLVVDKKSAVAESVRVHEYQGFEPDPASARRLKLLTQAAGQLVKPISVGEVVPDFTLIGQDGKSVTLSRFRGKVVALNFVYTRCALPNFCVRSSNNFGNLQTRFRNKLKRDLVLLTITFDPVHDSPEALDRYARKFNADAAAWHFLTGPETAIRRVCNLFSEDYFPDEGLMDHSLHTAIIDRQGRLVANLEGNEFTAQQLGDLVNTVLISGTAVPSR
jgi:protein SCO1/2